MNLSPHFTDAEFTRSETASRRGIDNDLPIELVPAARETCEMLERIRDYLQRITGRAIPVIISSGYRCQALNAAVGSSSSSDHLRACAADIVAPLFGRPTSLASALVPVLDQLRIGQIINEFPGSTGGGWVHVSTRMPEKPVNRIITITTRGTFAGVLPS